MMAAFWRWRDGLESSGLKLMGGLKNIYIYIYKYAGCCQVTRKRQVF